MSSFAALLERAESTGRSVGLLPTPESEERYGLALDQELRDSLRSLLLEFMPQLLPYCMVEPDGSVVFLGTSYQLQINREWDRSVLRVEFAPSVDQRLVDHGFPVDLEIRGCEFTSQLRLFPPRAEQMFEFHQLTVRDVTEALLRAGEEAALAS